jgi:hypothetical protein
MPKKAPRKKAATKKEVAPARRSAPSKVETAPVVARIPPEPPLPTQLEAGERRNLRTRRPEEDTHYQGARSAHLTADERRRPPQRAVERQPQGDPHWLTRAEAARFLAAKNLARVEGTRLVGWVMPPDTPVPDEQLFNFPDPPRFHQQRLQARGDLIGKVVRHLLKWLPRDDSSTTIPLTADEVRQMEEAVGRKPTRVKEA